MVDRRVTEWVWTTPKRGVPRVDDRAVLLAHGAGSDMHGAALVAVADALAAAGVPACGSTTRTARRARARPTDRRCSTRRRARPRPSSRGAPSSRPSGSCSVAGRWAVGTARWSSARPRTRCRRSVCCSSAIRCTPPGKPDQPRVEHFPRIRVPVLFVSGTRDSLASRGRPHGGGAGRSRAGGRSTGSTPPTTATGR